MPFWGRKESGEFTYQLHQLGFFLWVRELLTVNIIIFHSWPINLIQFKLIWILLESSVCFFYKNNFFAVCTDSKSSSVLLDRISSFISAVLRLCICVFLFDWKFSLSCSRHPLLVVHGLHPQCQTHLSCRVCLSVGSEGFICALVCPLYSRLHCVCSYHVLHMARASSESCGPEIKWLTIFFSSVHLQS